MTKELSDKIITALKKHYGPVSAALRYRDLYQLVIAVILSAQTTDVQVNSVTGTLFSRYPSFSDLAKAKKRDVEKIIRSTGFYRNKAAHIIGLSKIITGKYSGKVPGTFEELTSLPGVGRKSANVILVMGLGKPAFPVDTHIFRIANRIGYAHSKKEIDIEEALCRFIPEGLWGEAHVLLIHHGRAICRARAPLCPECPVRNWCESAPLFMNAGS